MRARAADCPTSPEGNRPSPLSRSNLASAASRNALLLTSWQRCIHCCCSSQVSGEFSRILPICCVNLHRTHVRRSPRRKGAAAMPPRTTTTKMVPILRFIRHVCAAQRSVDYHHHHTFARCVHGAGKWCDLCTLFGGLRWRGGSGAPMLTLTILLSLFWSTAAEVTEVA